MTKWLIIQCAHCASDLVGRLFPHQLDRSNAYRFLFGFLVLAALFMTFFFLVLPLTLYRQLGVTGVAWLILAVLICEVFNALAHADMREVNRMNREAIKARWKEQQELSKSLLSEELISQARRMIRRLFGYSMGIFIVLLLLHIVIAAALIRP